MHIETAPAKINLYLHVHGCRSDGMHELESLVVFAKSAADVVTVAPAAESAVITTGPFAEKIVGPNLAFKVLELAAQHDAQLQPMHVAIEKRLPVAAGIGGGSADAGAVLRALRSLLSDKVPSDLWLELAQELGADVPVCFTNRAAIMTGVGHHIQPVRRLPPIAAVLANPVAPVPDNKTAAIFKSLQAPEISEAERGNASPTNNSFEALSSTELMRELQHCRNDLEGPAFDVMPIAREVKETLQNLPGCQLARLSGAGPTSFALFSDMSVAQDAARLLQKQQPNWWVVATELS